MDVLCCSNSAVPEPFQLAAHFRNFHIPIFHFKRHLGNRLSEKASDVRTALSDTQNYSGVQNCWQALTGNDQTILKYKHDYREIKNTNEVLTSSDAHT